jgi:hypothetical protein
MINLADLLKGLDEPDKVLTKEILNFLNHGVKSKKGGKGYSVNEIYDALEKRISNITSERVEYLVIYLSSLQMIRDKNGYYYTLSTKN